MNILKGKYLVLISMLAVVIAFSTIIIYASKTGNLNFFGNKPINNLSHNNNTKKPQPENQDKLPKNAVEEPKVPEKYKVKGVYLTGWTAGTKTRLDHFINLLNNTELNTLVIDVKDDKGQLSYKSEIPLAKEINSSVNMISDIKGTLQKLKDNKIHTIARIVAFKDPILSEKRPDLALKTKSGHLWRDRKKVSWLNPYNKDSWQYEIDIAIEAAKLGFDEIQFDYVRFPTDGNVNDIDYGPAAKTTTKAEAINEFLAEAKKQLSEYGVVVSADVFGIITTNIGDLEQIGQDLETIVKDIDYISPMVYPSHYATGQYNITKPDLEPYKVVFISLDTAKKRISKLEGHKADIRPYLQDFTASWLGSGYYKKYTAEDVRAQIKATYDSGLEEWILWNPSNIYTEAALLPENE